MKLYKTIGKGFQSMGHKWVLGKWFSVAGDLALCSNGFHGSKLLSDAFRYVGPYYVCEVEIRGDFLSDDDKFCARSMRVVGRYFWTKRDSVVFAVWCARRVLKCFEEYFPDDRRPRLAVESAEAYLRNPCKKTMSAAESAASSAAVSAAWSAWSAASSAAVSAAWSAWSAARSAASSAAVSAAWSAARSAVSAAVSAASSAEKMAQHKKILSIIKNNGGMMKNE